ncbi:hypothetical protein, partial [Candidatus Deferrimicrobium sp.]|uniref:hypothetical protein n=1 Tax=Candidatus Deferrimicrobium sp. TaxID=3060586 RepID=UPI003C453A6B
PIHNQSSGLSPKRVENSNPFVNNNYIPVREVQGIMMELPGDNSIRIFTVREGWKVSGISIGQMVIFLGNRSFVLVPK